MLDITQIREDLPSVIGNLRNRGVEEHTIHALAALDSEWRSLTQEIETLRAELNAVKSKFAAAAPDEKESVIAELRKISTDLEKRDARLDTVATERMQSWRSLPNILIDDVGPGGEDDFEVIREVPGTIQRPDPIVSYLDLLPDEIDLERAAKVSGSRFAYLKGNLARLQMALVSYAFDQLTREEAGFTPVIPPVLIREEAMAGMGYLDKHDDEVYRTQDDDLYLTGTSEQSIGPMHMNEVIPIEELPLRYVGYSTCFRREAGSHGKDVKGILRLHQFDKVEMFSFTTPEKSTDEHEFLLAQQEHLMQGLELPYRVIKLAGGDLGMSSAKTYDIETWIPSENRYRETHSTSNTTDYQARRLNIRTKDAEGTHAVHMLNGTAFAIGRTLIAIMENYQQADGSIAVPEVLQQYVPFKTIEA